MLIMAERENCLPYYIAGEFEGIAVLEAATSGLQSAEVSNMESAIEYLHRKQNGGGGSWWYKHIQRAGADSAAGKELFNMKENTEEQKKRAEAVDMMKHIAAAWDIDAEEVFGRADE